MLAAMFKKALLGHAEPQELTIAYDADTGLDVDG
jgi:hypothetical protein